MFVYERFVFGPVCFTSVWLVWCPIRERIVHNESDLFDESVEPVWVARFPKGLYKPVYCGDSGFYDLFRLKETRVMAC